MLYSSAELIHTTISPADPSTVRRRRQLTAGMFACSRLWVMAAFLISFASLLAGAWVLFCNHVLLTGDHPVPPRATLFLSNFIIFASSCVYKFGRTEEM
ncbi:unnamed protein product [Haemonchus placei]|uniref:Transmembrane protein n=1 Tax=Haemonchus placei TaxID=6290 RepID=A0A0N4X5D7_HAEPC|nr:unnamed protein product [Haemonchus placei]